MMLRRFDLCILLIPLIIFAGCKKTNNDLRVVNVVSSTKNQASELVIDEDEFYEITDVLVTTENNEVLFSRLKEIVPELFCYSLILPEIREEKYCYCLLKTDDSYIVYLFKERDNCPDLCLGYFLVNKPINSSELENCHTLGDLHKCTNYTFDEIQKNIIYMFILDRYSSFYPKIDYETLDCSRAMFLTDDGFYLVLISNDSFNYQNNPDGNYHEILDKELVSVEKVDNPVLSSLAKQISTSIN